MSEPLAPPRSRWVAAHADTADIEGLLSHIDVERATAAILARRGIVDPEEAERFLAPSLDHLHDPWLMAGMREAVERLRGALAKRETILIHGDFDVDGLASTALLARSLTCLGASVRTHIPRRLEEGYGLHEDVADVAAQAKAPLVLSCDCGIRSHGVAQLLHERGIDLIITDHHEPSEELPCAVAVLDPKVPSSGYPFRQLAGVGVPDGHVGLRHVLVAAVDLHQLDRGGRIDDHRGQRRVAGQERLVVLEDVFADVDGDAEYLLSVCLEDARGAA